MVRKVRDLAAQKLKRGRKTKRWERKPGERAVLRLPKRLKGLYWKKLRGSLVKTTLLFSGGKILCGLMQEVTYWTELRVLATATSKFDIGWRQQWVKNFSQLRHDSGIIIRGRPRKQTSVTKLKSDPYYSHLTTGLWTWEHQLKTESGPTSSDSRAKRAESVPKESRKNV